MKLLFFLILKGTLTVHHFFKGISLHIFFQIFIVLHYSQILELKQHLQKLYYLTREKKQWIVKIKCAQWRFGHWLWRPNNWHDISIMLISEKNTKGKLYIYMIQECAKWWQSIDKLHTDYKQAIQKSRIECQTFSTKPTLYFQMKNSVKYIPAEISRQNCHLWYFVELQEPAYTKMYHFLEARNMSHNNHYFC